jgi:hypothetical protein
MDLRAAAAESGGCSAPRQNPAQSTRQMADRDNRHNRKKTTRCFIIPHQRGGMPATLLRIRDFLLQSSERQKVCSLYHSRVMRAWSAAPGTRQSRMGQTTRAIRAESNLSINTRVSRGYCPSKPSPGKILVFSTLTEFRFCGLIPSARRMVGATCEVATGDFSTVA